MGRSSKASLHELDGELARVRRRAARQKRNITSGSAAWQLWSTTMDDATIILAQLTTAKVVTVQDLAIKFSAILWAIEANERSLDTSDLRRLRAFQRELRQLASQWGIRLPSRRRPS